MSDYPIPDAALETDIAILGKKGKGKTYTAKGVVERLLSMGRRVLVLDPLGVWWGLRVGADGEGNGGFPIAVFGGEHGDMPLTEAMGRPLAKLIASENLPCVVDMGQMRKAAWQRLVRDMLDELFTKNRDPLWIVLEEADVFAPQQPREGDSAAVLGEVDRIARRGRAFGFRLISITQRPARLHKDVLTQLSTLVALGMSAPQDIAAIKAWVDGNADADLSREVIGSLATLKTGEGWVWAPDFDILQRSHFPAIRTLDTSATPKAGERRVKPKTLAQVDISAIREAMEAEQGIGGEKPANASPALSEAALRAEFELGYVAGKKAGEKQERERLQQNVMPLLDNIRFAFAGDATTPPEPSPIEASGPISPVRFDAIRPVGNVSPSARKLLDHIIKAYPLGLTLTSAAARAGISRRSSAYRRYMREAQESGEIVEQGSGRWVAACPPASAPTVSDGLSALIGALPPSYARMANALRCGQVMTRDEVAASADVSPTSSGLSAGLKELMALGIIEQFDNGYRLHRDFMEF